MLRKERLEMYKKALEFITNHGGGKYYRPLGLCDLFCNINANFKTEWGHEHIPSMFIIPEIYDQRTISGPCCIYWFDTWEEREIALRKAIYNIEREAPIN